jgi:hypothetical protein
METITHEIKILQKREMSAMERINQKETIYICYNENNNNIMFGTPSHSQALKFCRINNCNYSTYPPKTYTED